MPCDVIGVGASAVDAVVVVPEAPAESGPGSKLRILRRGLFCGGQTATAMVTCARLGLNARYAGAIGSDDDGRRIHGELVAHGVDVSAVAVRDAPTASSVIVVAERTGERIVLWERDARLDLTAREVRAAGIDAARLLHVDDVDEAAAVEAARIARRAGLAVTSDLENATGRSRELLTLVTYAIFAETVPPALTGVSDAAGALRALRRETPATLCVTLGRRGALALEGDRLLDEPAFDVAAVDTTGAGDVFRGGFIYGVLSGWPMDRTLRFASAAAAVACTRPGAMAGAPALDEVYALAAARGRPLRPWGAGR